MTLFLDKSVGSTTGARAYPPVMRLLLRGYQWTSDIYRLIDMPVLISQLPTRSVHYSFTFSKPHVLWQACVPEFTVRSWLGKLCLKWKRKRRTTPCYVMVRQARSSWHRECDTKYISKAQQTHKLHHVW